MSPIKAANGPRLSQIVLVIVLLFAIAFLIFSDIQKMEEDAHKQKIEREALKEQRLLLQFDANNNGAIEPDELSHSRHGSY